VQLQNTFLGNKHGNKQVLNHRNGGLFDQQLSVLMLFDES